MTKLDDIARQLVQQAPAQLDLTNPIHEDLTGQAADSLLACSSDPTMLAELENTLVARKDEVPLLVHLAAKLAVSRSALLAWTRPAHVSVVFAVYKEHQRIRPASEVAGGEDFLVRKIHQLDWLTAGREDLTWDMIVVDDGCPAGSGAIAADIIEREGRQRQVRVLNLAEAIAAGHPAAGDLTTPDDSRKGGSIQLGLWEACRQERENHVAVFTDADLSTHLGQTGLLMDAILAGGCEVAIGSRRQPESVVIKQGARNDRGKLFIYLWKRIIDSLPDVIDTQCGFKGFAAATLREILPGMLEKKFAFDIELLIKSRQLRPDGLAQRGIAWIDSDALSTTTDLQPYLPMLKAMVLMYRQYLMANTAADQYATFIDQLDEAGWAVLQENIPTEITKREPAEFSGFAGVSAEDLARAARSM
ncbi:MAG: hypothetical protein QNL91_10440 [Candidatus Krumholzibacteria bacterium]|nr:hypothetical protein [Candidatus Krumholzibacteria bacterium]